MATNYLRAFMNANPNWEQILSAAPYNLKISREDDYVLLKYNTFSSDFSDPIVCEARGIIFRENDNKTYTCVRRAFDKFFNYGEPTAADIDWSNFSVQEKIDGSLISVWFDNNKWHYSTNGSINMDTAPTGDVMLPTFGVVFDAALANNGLTRETFENLLNPIICYTFELVSPQTRVVIPYEKPDLYFIGARNMFDNEECSTSMWEVARHIKLPKVYSFDSLESIKEAVAVLPWDDEGYVVVDDKFNRIKVKSMEWVKAHAVRNNSVITTEAIIQTILDDKVAEFLTYADDYAGEVKKVEQKMNMVKETLRKSVCALFGAADMNRAEYAKYVKQQPVLVQDYLFKVNNGIFVNEYVANWTAKKWKEMIDAYDKSGMVE